MDDNQTGRRSRDNRVSQDLRRKVLLKNFLREQMSNAPVSSSSEITADRENESVDVAAAIKTQEVSVQTDPAMEVDNHQENSELQHNALPPRKITTFNFSKIAELKFSRFANKRAPDFSNDDSSSDLENNTQVNSSQPKTRTVATQVTEEVSDYVPNLQISTNRKTNKKGIKKAKYAHKNCKPRHVKVDKKTEKEKLIFFKSRVKRCFNVVHDFMTKNKKRKSKVKNYTLAKDFLEKVDDIVEDKIMSSEDKCINIKEEKVVEPKPIATAEDSASSKTLECITSEWGCSLREIRKLERANKRLREENKLLSDSLSSIMADVDVAFHSPYKRSSFHRPSINFQYSPSDVFKQTADYSPSAKPAKNKILRSRSVYEQFERRREIRTHLSSKSMCHRPYSRVPPIALHRAKPCIINPHAFSKEPAFYNRELPLIPNNAAPKPLSRRSSMPERSQRKCVINRRFSCAQDLQVSSNSDFDRFQNAERPFHNRLNNTQESEASYRYRFSYAHNRQTPYNTRNYSYKMS